MRHSPFGRGTAWDRFAAHRRAGLESDRDGLLCRSAPHIPIVEAAQARQRNQTGVGGWFWLDAPPIRSVFASPARFAHRCRFWLCVSGPHALCVVVWSRVAPRPASLSTVSQLNIVCPRLFESGKPRTPRTSRRVLEEWPTSVSGHLVRD